jgi:asparagine synthase (glutamine-hydrolyzing)
LISSIAQKQVKNKKLHTFSIGFDIESYNETHFAQIVANTIGSVHHNKILSQEEALNILQKLPHYYDEPFADSSMIPTFAVSQLAKESVSVALS